MSLFVTISERLRAWLNARAYRKRVARIMRECDCLCVCPKCDEPLNDRAKAGETERGTVVYVCRCGHVSEWDFDCPVPLLLKEKP